MNLGMTASSESEASTTSATLSVSHHYPTCPLTEIDIWVVLLLDEVEPDLIDEEYGQ